MSRMFGRRSEYLTSSSTDGGAAGFIVLPVPVGITTIPGAVTPEAQ